MDKIRIEVVRAGEDRFRKDMGDLTALKQSMALRGQLQPIILDRKNNLIAGERRLNCALQLGWSEVGYIYSDQADEITKKEMELEENICRKEMSPEEEVKAILAIHKLKQEKYGKSSRGGVEGWRLQDTADALGISKASVINYVTVAEHLEDMPEVSDTLKKQGVVAAYKLVRYKQEEAAAALMHDLMQKQMKEQVDDQTDETLLVSCAKIVDGCFFNDDCVNGIKIIPNESVHLIYTDPPYAIMIDEAKRGDEFTGDVYTEDTVKNWMSTWEVLVPELYRVAVPNAWAMIWISWDMVDILTSLMVKAGWHAHPLPYVWCRQGVGYQCQQPSKNFASSVDFALIFSKGDPRLNREGLPNHSLERALPDLLKDHPLERPMGLVVENITAFVSHGATVLDCFAGGGSTLKACFAVGMRPLCFEKSESYYKRTRMTAINMLAGRIKNADSDLTDPKS